MLYGLVMAGGSGTRLWPYSRSDYPKQFLHFGSHQTMLQETIARTLPIIPLERLFVATGTAYLQHVTEQVPNMPPENLVVEPVGRGTAASIGLAALQMRRRDPDAVMVVLSADHRIAHVDCYRDALELGAALAEKGHVVTLGLEPSGPLPGYGYIEVGESLAQEGCPSAYKVTNFVEKPDVARAEAFLASGRYVWNAGIFVCRVNKMLQELDRHQPELLRKLELVDTSIHTDNNGSVETANKIWSMIENISIDVAVMERTKDAVVVPANLGRQDVGDWNALFDAQPHDCNGNVVIGQHFGIETTRTLIYARQRVVATIGLEDFVIVDTDDAMLICPRSRVQDVKTLAKQLPDQYKYLG